MLKPGDIVDRNGGPADVFAVYPLLKPPMIFIMNKRTLLGEFVEESEVKFVRRPELTKKKQN